MSKASVPQGAALCSTPGTGNRKRRASSGQLLLPLDPAACDHRTISPLSPSRSPGRSQALIGQDPGPVAPPSSYQLQSRSRFSSGVPPSRVASVPMGSQSPAPGPLRSRSHARSRGVTRGHAPGPLPGRFPLRRAREGGRRKRKYGAGVVGPAAVGAVVLPPVSSSRSSPRSCAACERRCFAVCRPGSRVVVRSAPEGERMATGWR